MVSRRYSRRFCLPLRVIRAVIYGHSSFKGYSLWRGFGERIEVDAKQAGPH